MNGRAFLLGLAVGVFAAAAPSCGTTQKKCLRSNCAGCCDVNDECQAGTQGFACGADGRTCTTCMPSQSCAAGVCVGAMAGGGSAGGGMAGGGSAGGAGGGGALCANCNGCCENGACRGGNTFTACGFGGAACQNCQAQNKACNMMGQCVAFTCPGCLLDGGICSPGNSNLACGADAGACVQCMSNQTCFAGACVSATTCGPANCGGCCDGNMCVQTPSAMKCGSAGNLCITCGGGQICSNGSCMSGVGGGSAAGGSAAGGSATGGGIPVGGGAPGDCSLFPCLSGCCDANRMCKAGSSNSECGNPLANMGNCRSCSLCIPVPGGLGGACL
ncbi:MAG: hypothetical protein JNJ54_35380 [Myxococcaceae bacterium]|nr:hypothetical protein [Myxococcaceae bacterium]